VLVVDDDEAVLTSTSEILRRWGYVVLQARDSDEARELLRKEAVSLLLLDAGVSRDGLRLLDEIDRLPPVIVTSGCGHPPVVHPKINAFLAKPITPYVLMDHIGRHVDRSR
jgi:DNA-binding response OmpR family regulator